MRDRFSDDVRRARQTRMTQWGPTLIVVVLLAATAVAFATTERLKLDPAPIGLLRVTKAFSPRHAPALIVLQLRHAQILTLQIVNSTDRAVATLARKKDVASGRAVFRWRGLHVTDGVYEARVTLGESGRVFRLPNQIRVDSVSPHVRLVSYRPQVLRTPQSKPTVHISYHVSEPAHVILYVNGKRIFISYAKAMSSRVDWHAKGYAKRLPHGRYTLQLAAVDLAGNIGPRTPAFVVRIR